jgi:hypothetical protein
MGPTLLQDGVRLALTIIPGLCYWLIREIRMSQTSNNAYVNCDVGLWKTAFVQSVTKAAKVPCAQINFEIEVLRESPQVVGIFDTGVSHSQFTGTVREESQSMEFSVTKSALLNELTTTQGVIERKITIPILSNLLVEAKGSCL